MVTNLEIGYNGRLGNQMFQYAACYDIAKKLDTDFVIPKFNVDNEKHDGCWDFSNNKWISYRFRVYECFDITAEQVDVRETKYKYQEESFNYRNILELVQDDVSIQGYFQSEKYFIDSKEEILKEFTFKEEIYNKSKNIIKNFTDKEIVSVHIRRGDNIVNPTFPLISLEYIQQALDLFTDKEYNFLILSDDVEFCKQVLPEGDNIRFSNGESDFVDLCLMSLSNHNVISNSSFSWWGAYLNNFQGKKVVAPSDWFKDKTVSTKDLIPEEWVII